MSFTPAHVQMRDRACRKCGEGCEVNRADPCVGCYRHVWDAWGACPGTADSTSAPILRPIPASAPKPPSLLRLVRAWKRMGYKLVPRAERRQRAAICLPCGFVRRDPYYGLLACGAGCNCGAAGVSVMRADATCKEKQWLPPALSRA